MARSNIQGLESKCYCKARANAFAPRQSPRKRQNQRNNAIKCLKTVQLVDNRIRITLKSKYKATDKPYNKGE